MTDESPATESTETNSEEVSPSAQALLDYKKNSVPLEKYEGLQRELKTLTEGILNSNPAPTQEPAKPSATREELVNQIKAPSASNLEIATAMLELRDLVIKEGGVDPFLPQGLQVSATSDDQQRAQNVADVFKECIDSCNGDSGVFTALLSQRTRDIKIPSKKGN